MDSCYSGDHITEDNLHTDITTSDTEEPQQKYRLGHLFPQCFKSFFLTYETEFVLFLVVLENSVLPMD